MGQTMTAEHFGRVTSDGAYNTVVVIGRTHKLAALRATNMANAVVNVRLQESDTDSEASWETIYGQSLSPNARGVDFFAPVTWSKKLLRVQVSGVVDGNVIITEVSSKEAFCADALDAETVGTVGSWYSESRTTWCATYCQTGSQVQSCNTSCEAVCQSFYQRT